MTLSAADLGASELLQRVRHRLVETETQLRNLRNLGWRPDQLRMMNEEIGRLHSIISEQNEHITTLEREARRLEGEGKHAREEVVRVAI